MPLRGVRRRIVRTTSVHSSACRKNAQCCSLAPTPPKGGQSGSSRRLIRPHGRCHTPHEEKPKHRRAGNGTCLVPSSRGARAACPCANEDHGRAGCVSQSTAISSPWILEIGCWTFNSARNLNIQYPIQLQCPRLKGREEQLASVVVLVRSHPYPPRSAT